jgi:hypothetical protein
VLAAKRVIIYWSRIRFGLLKASKKCSLQVESLGLVVVVPEIVHTSLVGWKDLKVF